MKKTICYLLAMVLFAQPIVSTYVSAQDNSDVIQHLIDTSDEIMETTVFAEYYQYDNDGRISIRTVLTDNCKKQYSYSYTDTTFTETVEELGVPTFSPTNASISLMDSSNPDSLINSPELIKRINSYKDAWNFADQSTDLSDTEKAAIKDEAHIQAQIARADYCVINPTSKFAYSFLPDGRLNTGTAFRRAITPDMENEFSLDVMALQRTLIVYGYLDEDLASNEYGYYNTQTQNAVKSYANDKTNTSTNSATKLIIGKLFNLADEAQRLKRSSESLSNIGKYKLQHDLVCLALAAQVQTSGTVYREGYLYNAGVNDTGGRFDVVCNTGTLKYVWEVKSDSIRYGHSPRSYNQLNSYITASNYQINRDKYPEYCPMIAGFDIQDRILPWSQTYSLAYTSHPIFGPYRKGMVFYRPIKNQREVYAPDTVTEGAPSDEKSKEYTRIPNFDPVPVRNGILASEIDLKSVIIVGGTLILVGGALLAGQYWVLLLA